MLVKQNCVWEKLSKELSKRTLVMGVLNVTPDSFSDGGLYFESDKALRHARAMLKAGADIIDIGGESTRPLAEEVSLEEELRRVIPVIRKLAGEIDAPISIDTTKPDVARAALEAGAFMVNDISGLKADSRIAEVISHYNVPCVIMHMKGNPRTMQINPTYNSLIEEIISSLKNSIEIAKRFGIDKDKIIVDPGIGFGKTTEHNLEILKRLDEFKTLGYPLMIGTSRKSLISNVLGVPADERLMGTAATITTAILKGANIIRVHDVKEMLQVARMTEAIMKVKHFS